jgi:hypothetical protein
VDVYARFLPFEIIEFWLFNQPPLSSVLAKRIGFLPLQLIHNIMDDQRMAHCAFISALYFSSLWILAHTIFIHT